MTIRSFTGAASALALTLMLALPGAAEAQEGFELELRGGLGLSGGDHAEMYETGIGGGVAGIWWLTERAGVRIDGDLYMHDFDDEVQLIDAWPASEEFPDSRIFSAHLGGTVRVLNPRSSGVTLELNGGAGVSVFDTEECCRMEEGEPGDINDTFFSVGAGASLGFPIGPALLGVDWRLRYIFSDSDKLCPLTLYVEKFDIDPGPDCLDQGDGTADAMEKIVAYPISIFLRFRL